MSIRGEINRREYRYGDSNPGFRTEKSLNA
jgi:hypothetical protein